MPVFVLGSRGSAQTPLTVLRNLRHPAGTITVFDIPFMLAAVGLACFWGMCVVADICYCGINPYPHRTTPPPPYTTTIRKLRLSAFGDICRLQPGTQAMDIQASTPPTSWRRPIGRPPLRWADQIIKDTQMSLSDAVIATQDRPSWRSLVRDANKVTRGAGTIFQEGGQAWCVTQPFPAGVWGRCKPPRRGPGQSP